jgi:antitoxin component HigA of HigAB toxin-antitoxin module
MATAIFPPVPDTYMKLIREFPLRRIKTAAGYTEAKKLLLRIGRGQADRGAAEYLDVLVDLIADYEKRARQVIDTSKISAADLVRHRIQERQLSIGSLARRIDMSQSNLSEMLSGRRGWSKTAIRGLSSYLNIPADRFLAER